MPARRPASPGPPGYMHYRGTDAHHQIKIGDYSGSGGEIRHGSHGIEQCHPGRRRAGLSRLRTMLQADKGDTGNRSERCQHGQRHAAAAVEGGEPRQRWPRLTSPDQTNPDRGRWQSRVPAFRQSGIGTQPGQRRGNALRYSLKGAWQTEERAVIVVERQRVVRAMNCGDALARSARSGSIVPGRRQSRWLRGRQAAADSAQNVMCHQTRPRAPRGSCV